MKPKISPPAQIRGNETPNSKDRTVWCADLRLSVYFIYRDSRTPWRYDVYTRMTSTLRTNEWVAGPFPSLLAAQGYIRVTDPLTHNT